jgi:hypothetical protein
MQVKYLSALKTTYANFGLSREALDRVASQRVKTIANEEEIDNDIKSNDTLLLLMKEQQGAADAIRANHAKTLKELADLKGSQTIEPTPQNEPNSELTELKAMIQQLVAENAESKKKAHRETIINAVDAKMKEMGCDNAFIRKTTLEKVELKDTDTVDSLVEKYKSEYDANCKLAFGAGYVPPKGMNNPSSEVDYSAMIAGLKESGDL